MSTGNETAHSVRQRLTVQLAERSYPIEIGTGNLSALGSFVDSSLGRRSDDSPSGTLEGVNDAGVGVDHASSSDTGSGIPNSTRRQVTHAVIICDENVEETHAHTAGESLDAVGIRVDMIVVEPGEETKSVEMCEALWEKMLEVGADRKSIVVAVGGGVVGDLAGFVAATFARGLDFFQVPTTLLAQVDSSVGGKTGVNLPGAKNMVGAFWQPLGVLIDTAVLETLPDREFRAGLAEVVKYGVILDAEFFAWLEANHAAVIERQPSALRHIIARCCELKAMIVAQDERETTGLRAVLNYGHTFAHALEAVTGYGELLHGEAVAIGMDCAARLALGLGRIDASLVERQSQLLQKLGLPISLEAVDLSSIDTDTSDSDLPAVDALIEAMARDKKVEHGRLRFVLPTRLGHVELVSDVDPEQVRAVLAD